MEYLMTYGWAILIVIIVVAALWAMGVFTVTPTVACSPCFTGDLAFVDYAGGTLVLRNGPRAIESVSSSVGTPDSATYAANALMTITGITTTGDVPITVTYTVSTSGLAHNATATLHN